MARVRIGIFLIVFSWLPIAQVALIVAHNHQRLTSADASDSFRLTIWAIQVVIGLVGVWLVGKVAVDAAKTSGWKHLPANMWRLFRYGDSNPN